MTERFRQITERPGTPANRAELARAVGRYAFVADRAAGRDLLEGACGAGLGLPMLARAARSVTAGDIVHANVLDAMASGGWSCRVARFDVLSLPFRDGSFEVVALLEAIYYLDRPERFLAEAHRVLRHGGEVILSTVNPAWRDFGPSPLSVRYWDSRELDALLRGAGFVPSLSAAFPFTRSRPAMLASKFRHLSARLSLPWPSWARQGIRRILHGPPQPVPPGLTMLTPVANVPIARGARETDHQVLYAVGRKT